MEPRGSSSARLSLVIGRCLGTVVVTVGGDLEASDAQRLERVLADLIDGQGNLDVVLDLGGLSRLDPCGVDVLAAAADNSAKRGGRLRLGHGRLRGVVLEALCRAGLARLVGVDDDGPTLARLSKVPLPRSAPYPASSGRYDRRLHGQVGTA